MPYNIPITRGANKLVFIELGRINTTESIFGFHSGMIGDHYNEKYFFNYKDGGSSDVFY